MDLIMLNKWPDRLAIKNRPEPGCEQENGKGQDEVNGDQSLHLRPALQEYQCQGRKGEGHEEQKVMVPERMIGKKDELRQESHEGIAAPGEADPPGAADGRLSLGLPVSKERKTDQQTAGIAISVTFNQGRRHHQEPKAACEERHNNTFELGRRDHVHRFNRSSRVAFFAWI
ncbi:hypothetical protein [Rhizobium sp. BK376]|uniref:hypothetical protein n=1 Tax=Rhizobium sp. BK376 TaxID=2512149 RepID=UPI001A9E5149|nr:hypothetical protein [Rhizobium sp. BK376]